MAVAGERIYPSQRTLLAVSPLTTRGPEKLRFSNESIRVYMTGESLGDRASNFAAPFSPRM